jgi:hypothetical protein
MASLDWSECPAVESIPGKVSGAWVLRGTRMPVSAIFENIEARHPVERPVSIPRTVDKLRGTPPAPTALY